MVFLYKISAMKTKHFLIFLLSIFNLQLFSQDYDPILKEGSFWDTNNYFYNCSQSPYLSRIKIGKDTIINNKTYKKLFKGIFNGKVSDFTSCFIQSEPPKIEENNFYELKDIYLRENSSEKKSLHLE